MTLIVAFGGALAAMVVIDTVFLIAVLRPLFERLMPEALAESPDYLAAGLFYVLYAAGVTALVIGPTIEGGGGWARVLGMGAFFGLVAYGTFELTSKAVLKGWVWQVVAVDMAWGTLLTAIVAGAGYYAARSYGADPG